LFQFSLRTLLLIVVVASIACAVIVRYQARLRQREIAAQFQMLDGRVYYEENGERKNGLPYGTRREWLLATQEVIEVDFCDQASEETTERIQQWIVLLNRPNSANGRDDLLTGEKLAQLSAFPNLRRLDLSQTPISDRSFAHLSRLSKLETLELSATKISSESLRLVDSYPRLRELNLSGTSVDDAGLALLNRCQRLEELTLGVTYDTTGGRPPRNRGTIQAAPITDAGLATLRIPSLKMLNLRGTQITDAGLEHLKQLPQLQELNLVRTGITDDGLRHLGRLKQLTTLHLVEEIPVMMYLAEDGPPLTATRVTADGVKQLHAALPRLRIVYGVRPMGGVPVPSFPDAE